MEHVLWLVDGDVGVAEHLPQEDGQHVRPQLVADALRSGQSQIQHRLLVQQLPLRLLTFSLIN